MRAKKGGTVWSVLKWYGYDDWRLEDGVSLCKVFWSLVLGVPLISLFRGLDVVASYPGVLYDKKIARGGTDTGVVVRVFSWGLLLALLISFVASRFVDKTMLFLFAVVLLATAILLVIIGLMALVAYGTDKLVHSEFVGWAKGKVCPTIKFEEDPADGRG